MNDGMEANDDQDNNEANDDDDDDDRLFVCLYLVCVCVAWQSVERATNQSRSDESALEQR